MTAGMRDRCVECPLTGIPIFEKDEASECSRSDIAIPYSGIDWVITVCPFLSFLFIRF